MCRLIAFDEGKKVAEIKLPHIRNISEVARRASNISRIMLFGSSIEERCKADSDIDIAVFGDKTKGKYLDSKEFRFFKSALFRFDWGQEYDILYFKENEKCNAEIMKDISSGVEIYRRTC